MFSWAKSEKQKGPSLYETNSENEVSFWVSFLYETAINYGNLLTATAGQRLSRWQLDAPIDQLAITLCRVR